MKHQFKSVIDSNNIIHSRYIKIYWNVNKISQDCKIYSSKRIKHGVHLGVSVSKRNIPKAVDRNKYKRLVRESIRLSKLPDAFHLGLVNEYISILAVIKKQVTQCDKQILRYELDKQWQRVEKKVAAKQLLNVVHQQEQELDIAI